MAASPIQPPPRRRVRRWLVAGVAVLVLLGAGLLFFAPELLWVEQPCPDAELIVVLGGGSSERPLRALDLYRAGAAPRILLTGVGDWPRNRALLLSHGVPERALLVDPQATTTWENARNTAALMRTNGLHRAIVVTTWYHSRRAAQCFRRCAPDLVFGMEPSSFGMSRADWWRCHLVRYIVAEYPKMLWYWCRHGVPLAMMTPTSQFVSRL